jgi:hypothetical protein
MAGGFIRSARSAVARRTRLAFNRAKLVRLAFTAGLALSAAASAAPITFTVYDIQDAVLSGYGGWEHKYFGKITDTGAFVGGRTGDYTGGGGTLNDNRIGDSTRDTQLFITGAVDVTGTAGKRLISPRLFLLLDPTAAWYVERIEIYGGDISDNVIPGALTGLTVGISGPDGNEPGIKFETIAFGDVKNANGVPVNDRVDLFASGLGKMAAQTVVLSDFQGTYQNQFSITEITIYGTPRPGTAPIPLPGTLWLLMAALLALPIGRLGRPRVGVPR